jgi:hypothetical protein
MGYTYRFWKLNAFDSGGFTALSMWQFFDDSNNQISTAGVSASASSLADGDPSYPFDTSFSTFWNANHAGTWSNPEWIQCDFGSAVTVASIKLAVRQGLYYGVNFFQIQGSNDGSTWTNLGFYNPAVRWQSVPSGQTQTFVLDPNQFSGGISYRLLITEDAQNSYCGIQEWKFYDPDANEISLVGGLAFANSEIDENHPVIAAFDSIVTLVNSWASFETPSITAPVWLARWFPSIISLAAFSLTGGTFIQSPTAFCLQTSTDMGATWVNVECFTTSWVNSSGDVRMFTLAPFRIRPQPIIQIIM